jgi:hypothetical protein
MHLEESYSIQEELGDRLGRGHLAHSLGSLALLAGDGVTAERMLRRSLSDFDDLGLRPPVECLADLGGLALSRGALEESARFLLLAERIREEGGPAMAAADRERFDHALAQVEARLGEESWGRIREKIGAEDVNRAIHEALRAETFPEPTSSPG